MNVHQKIFSAVLFVSLFPGTLGIILLGLSRFFSRAGWEVPEFAVLFLGIFCTVVSFGGVFWVLKNSFVK